MTNHPAAEPSGPDHAAAEYSGLVIAVDGPAGSGKSTAARGVARALGLRYLDTGATYRALTWWLLDRGVDVSDAHAVARHLDQPVIEMGTDPDAPEIRVDGTDVAGPIRTREVSNAVSAVASLPEVRRRLIAMQQQIIAATLAAGEGRGHRGPRHRHRGRARRAGEGVPDGQRNGPGPQAHGRSRRRPGRDGRGDPGRSRRGGIPPTRRRWPGRRTRSRSTPRL